jgi:hypothetical protein
MRRLGLLFPIVMAGSALWLAGCSTKPKIVAQNNMLPTVRLTSAPYSSVDEYYYSITLNWTAFDPDGRVDYFLYAIDPPRPNATVPFPETTWVRTDRNELTYQFPATRSKSSSLYADDFHVFALRAVDNRGGRSLVTYRAFFAQTQAPTVKIDSPPPSLQSKAFVTPAVLIQWHGDDLDGVFTKKPKKYKYFLISDQTEVTLNTALVDRDSVRRYYQPRNWVGWDSTSTETTYVQYTNLIPDKEYIFCVVAFDEAGAYSPIFELNQNMLYFRVSFAGNNNPTITMWNEFFSYTYPGGSYEPLNPERVVPLEIPAGERVTFNWAAEPIPGSVMRSYRWALDITDLNDETRRRSPDTDLNRWSDKSLAVTSATIGPFIGSNVARKFYIEAEDINGLKSLGIIGFTVVTATFDRPLLVVKDWRYQVDVKTVTTQPCVDRPKLQWPNSAELDSFLFARGGFPWKCYTPAAVSKPGLFAGYDFDTAGTRIGRADQTVPLSKLARYRHVIWITDAKGASNGGSGTSSDPAAALKYMCAPNRANTIATYGRMGGQIWMLGGGAATAATDNYNSVRNDTQPPAPGRTYTVDYFGELVPGRFMYDFAKWQSEIKPSNGNFFYDRLLGRNTGNPFYNGLPTTLDYHSEADGDSFPPGRTYVPQLFYYDVAYVEYLSKPNQYQEDIDPGDPENFQSALDTLYAVRGASLVQPSEGNANNVIMTIHPARSISVNPKVVFSGFDIWSYRRWQCQAIVDFVVRDLWGLQRTGPSFSTRARAAASEPQPGPGFGTATAERARAVQATRSLGSVRTARDGAAATRKPR